MFCGSPWCWDPWIPETWQQRSNGSICMYEQVNFSDISAVQIERKTLNIFCSREILWNDRLHWIDWLMCQSRKGFYFERFWTEHWRYNIRRVTQLWPPLALESLKYEVTVSRVGKCPSVPGCSSAWLAQYVGMSRILRLTPRGEHLGGEGEEVQGMFLCNSVNSDWCIAQIL